MKTLLVEEYEERYAVEPRTGMGFDQIFSRMCRGLRFKRTDGPADIAYIALHDPIDRTCDDREPYFCCVTTDGEMLPYTFSNADLLSKRWVKV